MEKRYDRIHFENVNSPNSEEEEEEECATRKRLAVHGARNTSLVVRE